MLCLLHCHDGEHCKMLVVTFISHRNQSLVKPTLISATLIASDQQNRLPLGVEGKGNTLDAAIPTKTQFHHVGVLRTLQPIDRWTTQIRSKLTEQQRMRQQFVMQAQVE